MHTNQSGQPPRRPRAARAWLAPLAVMLASLASCPPRAKPHEPHAALSKRTADEVLAEVVATEESVESVIGEAKLRVVQQGKSTTATVLIAARAPASLRVEVLDFFGRPQLIVVGDERAVAAYNVGEQTVIHGSPTAELLAELVGFPLELREAVAVLLGRIPRLPGSSATLVTSAEQAAEGYEALLLSDGLLQQALVVDNSARRVVSAAPSRAGRYAYRASNLRTEGGRTWAYEFALLDGSRELATLRWKDVTFNEGVSAATFQLQLPSGVSHGQFDAPPQ